MTSRRGRASSIPSRARLIRMRARSARDTSHCREGAVLISRRSIAPSAVRSSIPATSASPWIAGPRSGSAATSAAASSSRAWTRGTSWSASTRTSMSARDHPWVMLPTRRISPLRTYQSVPSSDRTCVTRRPTCSTTPLASPRSTTSPTPYWSSASIEMPARKSFTSVCAPNPSATPTTPAEASRGPTSTCRIPRISTTTRAPTMNVAPEPSAEPIVLARCARRAAASGLVST